MSVLVAGAALMDLLAHSRRPIVPGTSNPARLLTSPGGVGRNIAENLARLGTPVTLLAVIGPDAYGDALLDQARAVGIDTSEVLTSPQPTGTYLAVLDADGELSVALSDVSATEALTVTRVEGARAAVESADLLVIDANLPVSVVGWLLDAAADAGVRVVLDPVSVPKAERILPALAPDRPIWVLTPNADELAVLGDVTTLRTLAVANVWVRQGPRGSDWYAENGSTATIPGIPATVVDVTGAGDAATAGFVHAVLAGADEVAAVAYGHACASLTVAHPQTVRDDLTDHLVRTLLEDTR